MREAMQFIPEFIFLTYGFCATDRKVIMKPLLLILQLLTQSSIGNAEINAECPTDQWNVGYGASVSYVKCPGRLAQVTISGAGCATSNFEFDTRLDRLDGPPTAAQEPSGTIWISVPVVGPGAPDYDYFCSAQFDPIWRNDS